MEVASLKQELQRARIQAAMLLVTLDTPAGGGQSPKLADLKCKYIFSGDNIVRNGDVLGGYFSGQYKIHLTDVSMDRTVATLTIEDAATGRRWGRESFSPLEPAFVLKALP